MTAFTSQSLRKNDVICEEAYAVGCIGLVRSKSNVDLSFSWTVIYDIRLYSYINKVEYITQIADRKKKKKNQNNNQE